MNTYVKAIGVSFFVCVSLLAGNGYAADVLDRKPTQKPAGAARPSAVKKKALTDLNGFLPSLKVPASEARLTRQQQRQLNAMVQTILGLMKTLEDLEESRVLKSSLARVREQLEESFEAKVCSKVMIQDAIQLTVGLVDNKKFSATRIFDADHVKQDFLWELKILEPLMTKMATPGESLTSGDIETIISTGNRILDLADSLVLFDSGALSADAKAQIQKRAELVKRALEELAASATDASSRLIDPTYQVAAKAAVFAIQACLEIAAVMGIQQQKYSLSADPAHQSQRAWYRRIGICSVSTALVLAGFIVVGNAVGVIDIQTVFNVKELLLSLSGVLA